MTDFFEPAGRGVQHASLRAANRRAVLTTITFNPGISNADVSRRTGLAPQTASAIVTELETEGLISRGEVLRGRRGQPATPLFLDYDAACSIGCEISWRHIDIVLIDLGSREIGRYRRDYAHPDPTTIIAEAASAIGDLLGRLDPAQRHRLIGIGLASPNNVGRSSDETVSRRDDREAWQKLDLRAALEAATGISTHWYNDGNAACWAELAMHAAPRPSNFAYLFLGTFLGAGIIAEHTLWEGPSGNSANLGAMLVSGEAGTRRFGYQIASLTALVQRLEAAGIAVPTGNPIDWPWADWEPHLSAWLQQAGQALAQIIVNVAAVIEFELAIIDSAIPPELVSRLVDETRAGVQQLPTVASARRPLLSPGTLGARAVPLGAAQLPMFRKLFSRQLSDMLG